MTTAKLRREWTGSARLFVFAACLSFLLYAALGRAYAYIGVAPIYIGECLLMSGLVIGVRTGKALDLVLHPLGLWLLCFTAWEAFCAIPYLSTYGIDTLRDSVLWAYSFFAWIVAALALALPGLIVTAIDRFKVFGSIFVLVGPVFALISEVVAEKLPKWPGTDVTIPNLKCGDLCVHLAGVLCFMLVGLGGNHKWWIAPCLCGFVIGSSINRGGGVAFLMAVLVILILYPDPKRYFLIVAGVLAMVLAVTTIDFRIQVARSGRDISSEQLIRNVSSIGNSSQDSADLQNTKRWRMEWWRRIIDYTLHGPYFWTGKGFGVNLTISDGIEDSETAGGLRSPHNSHLNFLARSGVPGFVLWLGLQGSWAAMILGAHWAARRLNAPGWAALFAWLLSYWLAFLINASFDVSLEGPTIAIPFWLLWGLGWGATLMFRRQFNFSKRLTGQRLSAGNIAAPAHPPMVISA